MIYKALLRPRSLETRTASANSTVMSRLWLILNLDKRAEVHLAAHQFAGAKVA
jgi:hypothetical protein